MLNLVGKTTPNGWEVIKKVEIPKDHTPGFFSEGYHVKKDGQTAFLKALNITKFSAKDVGAILASFSYESALLELCKDKGLNRIVKLIEADQLEVNPKAIELLRFVPFIVFELANGDIRDSVRINIPVSNTWRFHLLHQTTLALIQLHRQQIAHQDLKPANVLKFENGKVKIGDLGRSSLRGKNAPHDSCNIPGSYNYAPFELRYGYLKSDWLERRQSVDIFHLGCLVVFSFTNIPFPEFVISRLASSYKPEVWGDSYENVVAEIRKVMIESIQDLSKDFPIEFRNELIEIVKDLCDPDPVIRGNSNSFKPLTGALWLEKYVSKFDILRKKSEIRKGSNLVK
jgi:serine/threonine protein kinase